MATAQATTTVVCASDNGTEVVDGSSIIVLQIAKAAEVWTSFGDFAGAEVLVKDQKRFTLVGPNYLITVYHSCGAFIAVKDTIPLFCKELTPSETG